MILKSSIAPRNSILFIFDPTITIEVPEGVGATLVAATRTCISVGTLAEMDGETTIYLSDEFVDPVGRIVFDGFLETAGKQVSISDVSGENILSMKVMRTISQVTIWANDLSEPDIILVMVG